MCLLPSEESLSCAMNTALWPQKTTYILNNPQRQKGHTKRNNAYLNLLQEKKDLRSTPCNWRESISSSVSSLCNKLMFPCSFRAKNEEQESKTKRKTSSCRQPPPISHHLFKTPKFSRSKPYSWNLSQMTTFCNWPQPLLGLTLFNCFPNIVFNLL